MVLRESCQSEMIFNENTLSNRLLIKYNSMLKAFWDLIHGVYLKLLNKPETIYFIKIKNASEVRTSFHVIQHGSECNISM